MPWIGAAIVTGLPGFNDQATDQSDDSKDAGADHAKWRGLVQLAGGFILNLERHQTVIYFHQE